MATFRWPSGFDPLSGLRYMQRELDRLMGRGPFAEAQRVGGGTYPPVNVLSGEDDMIVQCEVPGIPRDDVDISITGETLVIRGTKRPAADEEEVNYQRRERGSGDFSRTIVLPDRVDADRTQAALADGILTIRLPKAESAKPKKVPVT